MNPRLATLYESYGALGLLHLAMDLAHTRLRLPNARLLRRPARIRGRRWMRIGDGLTTGPGLRLDAFPTDSCSGPILSIGRDVEINDSVHIAATNSVSIGDRVLIASKVFITDHNHGCYKGSAPQQGPEVPPAQRSLHAAPVYIGDDVWIGEFAVILPGVTIGSGSVIGAMSVVTRDVPPHTIVAGSPARAIKRYNGLTLTWEAL